MQNAATVADKKKIQIGRSGCLQFLQLQRRSGDQSQYVALQLQSKATVWKTTSTQRMVSYFCKFLDNRLDFVGMDTKTSSNLTSLEKRKAARLL